MIKTEKVTKEITETVVVDVLCNKCGCSLLDSYKMNYEGLVEAGFTGGYGSKIGDMNRVKFSLCEDCLLELFKTFKHEPYIHDVGDDFENEEETEEKTSDREV
jgi:hypothetical protein